MGIDEGINIEKDANFSLSGINSWIKMPSTRSGVDPPSCPTRKDFGEAGNRRNNWIIPVFHFPE